MFLIYFSWKLINKCIAELLGLELEEESEKKIDGN